MDYHQERLEYTIKVLKALTKNRFNIKESDELPDKVSGLTRNNHPILSMFALPTNWTIYFENETAIPHEICHAIDSISTYGQKSLRRDFNEIVELYVDQINNTNISENQKKYHSRRAEIYARLLNWWVYDLKQLTEKSCFV